MALRTLEPKMSLQSTVQSMLLPGELTQNSTCPTTRPSHSGLWTNYALYFLKKIKDQVGERMRRKYVLINNGRNSRWEEAPIPQL